MFWTILIVVIFILFMTANSKIHFFKLRSNSLKITAEVVEYRKEKGSMRNDYTLLNYPYVRIDLDEGGYVIRKLRYANNYSKPFKIGQKIYVFWNDGDLLYWNTYDKGIYKYFPESWKSGK